PNWANVANVLPLGVFNDAEAVDFLCRRTRQNDKQAAEALAKEMGCLPLALEQAGAYIEQTGNSLSEYLSLFKKHRGYVLTLGIPVDYLDTVATTWEMSFQTMKKESPASTDLLNLLSFLFAENVPKALIFRGKKLFPEPLASALANEIKFNQTIATLRSYSLVSVTEYESLSVHQLVQTVTRLRLKEDEKTWAEIAVNMMDEDFKFDPFDAYTWRDCSKSLSHALTAAGWAESLKVAQNETGNLLHKIGRYYKERADYSKAKEILGRALIISRKEHGFIHPAIANILNDIGSVMLDSNDLWSAIGLLDEALVIAENTVGPDHPSVASILVNRGMTCRTNSPLAAKSDHERALKIDENNFGLFHPYVARDLKSLGADMDELGDAIAYRELSNRGMEIIEARYGTQHHEYASFLNNIGVSHERMGELAEAAKCYKKALAIDEQNYGPFHPKVAKRLNNLGIVMTKLGNLQVAKKYLDRASSIVKENSGYISHNNQSDITASSEDLIYDNKISDEYFRSIEFYFKGIVEETHENYKKAIEVYNEILKTNPEDMQALHRKGKNLLIIGSFKESINCFDKIIELDKKQYNDNYAKGDDLVKHNKFREALSCYVETTQLLDLIGYTLYYKGMAHFNLDQHEKAVDALKKAVEMEFNNSTFRVTLAGFYKKIGILKDHEDQITKSKKIIDYNLYNPGTYNLACFYAVSGNEEEALTKIEEAAKSGQLSSEWIQIDPDLEELRTTKKFKKILKNNKKINQKHTPL
ncbi:MAG: tetratricopeptide repeat protein, partial [Methanothrix sp.]|nr:tetratricopeptide repeat protein [Methanothrix sp.]